MPEHIFIIAEAGVNHNGNIGLAKKLVDVASECGADAVKFQTFIGENCISAKAPKAGYQLETTDRTESQLGMIKKLELSFSEFKKLKKYCEQSGIMFLSTPFDLESADFLDRLGVKIMKIPSGEITNLPLLRKIGKMRHRVIMSTGMAGMDEIKAALAVLRENGTDDITLLHCNTQYPTPYSDVNLRAMETIRKETELPVGYSDHTLGIETSIAAAVMGAHVIEKHFTLDKNMEGPDHKASLEPDELRRMIIAIRHIEQAFGDGRKEPSASEYNNIAITRKSIIAKRDIRKGEVFTEDNLTVKRPGTGISPMLWDEIIGQKAKRVFGADELIEV